MEKVNKNKGVLKKLILALLIVSSLSASLVVINTNAICNVKNSCSHLNIKKLKTKNQLINGPCWAFANIATLETFLNKKGLLNESLSEKHLLSWVNQGSFDDGWNVNICDGGNCQMANAYFTSGSGPVFENNCKYNTLNTSFNSSLASLKPQYLVKGIKKLKVDTDSIKEAISMYGAVTVSYAVDSEHYHAVSLVGWNDNDKNWIVKDSSKEPNYVFLPFDKKFLYAYCITDACRFNSNQKIYQHDKYGVCGDYSKNDKIIAANVFDFNGNESLDSIMLYSLSANAKINLFLAPVLDNGTPNHDTSTWKPLYSGVVPYEGYSTFSLKNKINLNKGKQAIVVEINKNFNSEKPSLGCQMPVNKLNLGNDNLQRGKSFINYDNSFYDIKDSKLNNVSAFSIKAITKK